MVAGGWKAIKSVLNYSRQIGAVNLVKTLNSKNACKACAFGTGGQNGGFYNEQRSGIEICNKNIQAHTSDTRAPISNTFFLENSISKLRALSAKELEALGRIGTPLYKKPGAQHYSPITYEQAESLVAKKIKQTNPHRSFFYASGRSSNEAAFSLQLLARVFGTNNVNNCSYYCHQASGDALSDSIGTSTATVEYDDLNKCDTLFLFGANPASNHPRFLKALIKLRRRGGQVIVVNPAKESGLVKFASPSDIKSMLKGGEEIASQYIQPHIGGDIAFMQGLMKSLAEHKVLHHSFIEEYCDNGESFFSKINNLDWLTIEKNSGISREVISSVAKLYAKSSRTIFCWSMGLTHHLHGVANIQTLVALALSRGMIGKPGAGLLPLRGHSNIQGTGSMGFTPKLKAKIEAQLTAQLGIKVPAETGLDTMSCMEAASAGRIDLAIMLGGNLYSSNPDAQFAEQALNNIPFKCFINSTLNHSHTTAVDGECIIFPIKVRDEENQPTTQESMFNFVRLSSGGIPRSTHLKSEMEIICSLGHQVVSESVFNFKDLLNHQYTRSLISKTIPGYNNLQKIDDSKDEFHIDGRIFHTPQFPTPTGKARFVFHPSPARKQDVLLLMTVRSEGQFNSIIFHEEDAYRGQERRDVLMMNKDDIRKHNLEEGQKVHLSSSTGQLKNLIVKAFDILPGNIMTYYPEANILIPRKVDKVSKTPAFKSIEVTIEKALEMA